MSECSHARHGGKVQTIEHLSPKKESQSGNVTIGIALQHKVLEADLLRQLLIANVGTLTLLSLNMVTHFCSNLSICR